MPIYDDNGNLIAIEGIARDITCRKQLEETLEASNRRLAAFLRVSKAVTSATEQGSLLRMLVESAAEVTELQSNAIYLKNGHEVIRLVAATPSIPEDFPEKFRVAELREHPHIRSVMETGESLLIRDTSLEPFTPAEKEVVTLRDLRTVLYVPIRLGKTPIGVLILSSINVVHSFAEEEIALLQEFADQAARLLEKTREYDRVKSQLADHGETGGHEVTP